MRHRVIHLINPKTESLTTRPLYLNRALYSPLAGLLAVAAGIPRDRYEVLLTDENIESIDFDLKADLVGISAMTSYVNRGYEIADAFRARGVPVAMGGVHPSFMSQEALQHCDAVCVGEVELVLPELLDDLEQGQMRGIYRSERLHPMEGLNPPRYDLLKRHRYVNSTFVQTSRGCHQGCTFCAEPLMNGLKFRYRPVDEVMREIDNCGSRMVSIHDADFFGTPDRPKEVMRALKGRKVSWQAGVTSKLAQDDRMLELAATSGCTLLSIGFESITRSTLTSVHKHVNRPETFASLVEKVHSYGIMVFGLQHRRRLRRVRLLRPHALSRHLDVVRAQEGRPHRLLRLDEVRPGQRGVPAAAHDGRSAPARPDRGLRAVLLAVLHGPALPGARLASTHPVDHLQFVHEEGRGHRPQGRGGPGHAGAHSGAHAPHPAVEAGVARSRPRGNSGSGPLRVSLAPAALDPGRRRLTLFAVCVGQGMILLDNTIVNVALPAIQ